MSKCTLVCDARERHILRHNIELNGITYIVKQITIGDYAIIDPNGKILVVIERKSLEDAAASMKDGRWANRDKMIKLREQTGCAIIFIIEGLRRDNYEYREQLCGKFMPYKHLESSIFHMMVRDQISTIWTKDTIDTARTLVSFVRSMDTVYTDIERDQTEDMFEQFFTEGGFQNKQPEAVIPNAEGLLTQVHKTDDKDIVREMWSCFRGISVVTADEFMKKYSISEIIAGVPKEELENIKTATGRKVSKNVVKSLGEIDSPVEIRLLSKVPGISNTTAKEIIEQTSLRRLLTYDVGAISIIKVGKTKRNLGVEKAERVKKMFAFKYPQAVAAPEDNKVVPNEPAVDLSVDELDEFLDSL